MTQLETTYNEYSLNFSAELLCASYAEYLPTLEIARNLIKLTIEIEPDVNTIDEAQARLIKYFNKLYNI
jgi:hypothetical protein